MRKHALDPRNFKNSGDLGTLAVRYVVQVQGFENTVLRIDAVFVEDLRHTVHLSNGSVESEEYKDIRERLDAVELMKKENAEALRAKQDRLAKENFGLGSDTIVLSTPPPETPIENTHGESPMGATRGQAWRRTSCPLNRWSNASPSCAVRWNGSSRSLGLRSSPLRSTPQAR